MIEICSGMTSQKEMAAVSKTVERKSLIGSNPIHTAEGLGIGRPNGLENRHRYKSLL